MSSVSAATWPAAATGRRAAGVHTHNHATRPHHCCRRHRCLARSDRRLIACPSLQFTNTRGRLPPLGAFRGTTNDHDLFMTVEELPKERVGRCASLSVPSSLPLSPLSLSACLALHRAPPSVRLLTQRVLPSHRPACRAGRRGMAGGHWQGQAYRPPENPTGLPKWARPATWCVSPLRPPHAPHIAAGSS